MCPIDLFLRFRARIASAAGASMDRSDLLLGTYLLEKEGRVEVHYAPFDYVNARARLVLVGACPGLQQMGVAFRAAREAIAQGLDDHEALRRAKYAASYSGPTRTNLVRMLDALGVQDALDLGSSAELFGRAWGSLQLSAAVRYPVFVDGRNYTGCSPGVVRSPLLRRYVDEVLGPELELVSGALVIPLGQAGTDAVEHLIAEGRVDPARCLLGVPHPSGANMGRIARWLKEDRASARRTVRRNLSSSGRETPEGAADAWAHHSTLSGPPSPPLLPA